MTKNILTESITELLEQWAGIERNGVPWLVPAIIDRVLAFLLIAYCAIATITGIILFVWQVPNLWKMPAAQPISAAALAPIFEDVGTVVPKHDQPSHNRSRKTKTVTTLTDLIKSEAVTGYCCET